MPVSAPPGTGQFWQVCQSGTNCLPWNPVGGQFGVNGARSDYGVPLPVGTPIAAPVSGVVLPQHPGGGWYSVFGKQTFGGEVDILTNMPEYGGLVNVGVIHLDTASVQPGQVVRKGDIIGTSGGQTSGGNWPSSPQFSSGPHVGVQVHQVQSWNALMNPATLMNNLFANRDTSSIPTQSQLQAAGLSNLDKTLQSSAGQGCDWKTWLACISGLNPAACIACQAQGGANIGGAVQGAAAGTFMALFPQLGLWGKQPIRILKLFAGAIIFGIALIVAFLPDIAAAGVTAAGVPEAAPLVRQTLRGNKGPAGFIRSGLATGGAIQGRRTLKRREMRGVLKQQQAEHTKRSEAAKRGAQTRKQNKDTGIRRVPTTPGEREMLARGRNKRYEASKATQGEPAAGGPLKASKPGKIPSVKQRRAAETAKSEARRQQFREGLKRMGRPDLEK